MLTAIGQCSKLRRLVLPTPPGLAVVGQLPLLRELGLQPTKHATMTKKGRDALLAAPAALSGLRRLEVHLPRPNQGKAAKDRMATLLDELLSSECKPAWSPSVNSSVSLTATAVLGIPRQLLEKRSLFPGSAWES